MAQLLCAFAYASDLAFGLQLEDSMRSCYLALRLAQQMDLPEEECRSAYYTALLKDAGCTSWTTELATAWQTNEIVARRELLIFTDMHDKKLFVSWMRQFVAAGQPTFRKLGRYCSVLTTSRGLFTEAFATTATIAARIASRLGLPDGVGNSMLHMFEQWDGGGAPRGLAGDAIPISSRIVLPTFSLIPFHRAGGREAALEVARKFSGRAFDPDVVRAFETLSEDESFWDELEAEDIRDRVIALEPASEWQRVGDERIDDAALAFADFVDLKSRYKAAHSRRVGAVAEQLARLMHCAEEAVVQIRRAALMHDLGVVAVPSYTLERPWRQLSESEQDEYRLYPYHGERILRRAPVLAP
ncbi:MAG TPA: HD domain-containing phosphohydrolase, partial [Dehalococcoidia bacterium]|nr:HD domain-containing phosphohydrolase [Dehalococcoidia bacterium]